MQCLALSDVIVIAEARHSEGQGKDFAGYAAAALQRESRVHYLVFQLFRKAVVDRGHCVVEGVAGVGGRAAEGGFAVDIFAYQHHAAGNEVVYVSYFIVRYTAAAVTICYAYQSA